MKKIWYGLTVLAAGIGFFLVVILPANWSRADLSSSAPVGNFYLVDTLAPGDGSSQIYLAELDPAYGKTRLMPLGEPLPYDQVEALAAEPNGDFLYFIDKATSQLGIFYPADLTMEEIGQVVVEQLPIASNENENGEESALSEEGNPETEIIFIPLSGIVSASVHPDGSLYVISETDNQLYLVDTATALARPQGKVLTGNLETLPFIGADLAFTSTGSLYISINKPALVEEPQDPGEPIVPEESVNPEEPYNLLESAIEGEEESSSEELEEPEIFAANGLYLVADLSTEDLTASLIQAAGDTWWQGLAVLGQGEGDFVRLNQAGESALTIDRNGNIGNIHHQLYLGEENYLFSAGDLTAGKIIKPLQITTQINAGFFRTWQWNVAKTSEIENLTLTAGENISIPYSVTIGIAPDDGDWYLNGSIYIYNPNIVPAHVTKVENIFGGERVELICHGIEFPYTLEAGESMFCWLSLEVQDTNYTPNKVVVETSGVVRGNFYEEEVGRDAPEGELDNSVFWSDSLTGKSGTFTKNDIDAMENSTFTYEYSLDPIWLAGQHEITNTFTIITADKGRVSSDSHTIGIFIPSGGCTLGQGYWKTHSSYGPAPADFVWTRLTQGPDTPFFKSGQSFIQVLWTAPKAGGAYYQLAYQFIAAQLNILKNTTYPGDVPSAYVQAATLFNQYTPSQAAAFKKDSLERKEFLRLAKALEDYNEGITGPGHCDVSTAASEAQGVVPESEQYSF